MADESLEAKLDKAIMDTIWISAIDDYVKQRVHPYWFNANGQTFTFGVDVGRIKQVLRDVANSGNNYDNLNGHLMTGQEWYDRFEKELPKDVVVRYDSHENVSFNSGNNHALHVAREAAKKAAGIE